MAADRIERPGERMDVEDVDGADGLSKKNADPKGLVDELRRNDSVGQTLLAAVVAWATTVAPAVFSRVAPRTALLAGVLALAAGVAGPLLRARRPELARHVGITLFFILVTLAWMLGASSLEPLRLDTLRASVGAIAWGAFALSWREPWDAEEGKEQQPEPGASLLPARSALPRGAIFIVTVGVVAGLVLLLLAWQVRDGDRALVAQALAVACAVATTTVAASAAVERGKRVSRSNRRMTAAAGRALLLLFTFLAAGIAVVLLRE